MMEDEGAVVEGCQYNQQAEHLVQEVRTQTLLHWNYLHLRSLPPELAEEGEHVEQINLKCNTLTALPDNFGRLKNLTCCYLNSNNLKSLPDSIGDLKSLAVLDVGNNSLHALPASLGTLPVLRSLIAVQNRLTTFPSELCQLKTLSILMLSGNQLTALPSAMEGLRGLMGLYLDHNLLRELPRSLTKLPVLAHVSCCSNRITHLPALPFVANPMLYYDNNAVNYLPFAMVRHLRVGLSWDPVIFSSHIPKVVMEENTVRITSSPNTHPQHPTRPTLVLPPQVRTVSIHVPGVYTVPPLKELCLSFIYGAKAWPSERFVSTRDWKRFLPGRGSGVQEVPKVLFDTLEEGPIACCDNLKCQRSIFTHATIVAVPISVMRQSDDVEQVEVPMVLYFCSEKCAVHLQKFCQDNWFGCLFQRMAVWMEQRLTVEVL